MFDLHKQEQQEQEYSRGYNDFMRIDVLRVQRWSMATPMESFCCRSITLQIIIFYQWAFSSKTCTIMLFPVVFSCFR